MTEAQRLPAVELRDISFSYPVPGRAPINVVDKLSVNVQPGEIISLIGPSGSGKTTILRIIAGLLEPTGGMIRVSGRKPGQGGAYCGYVPQGYSLFPWLTVRKNIEYGIRLTGSARQTKRASEELLQMTRLQDFADNYPNALSGGMKQRVAIARALAIDPDVILLDEPFTALDIQTRADVQQYFLEVLQQRPKAVLLVTHDILEAVILADRILILSARPASVRSVVQIPLPRPRPAGIRESNEVLKIYRDVAKLIWSETESSHAKLEVTNTYSKP